MRWLARLSVVTRLSFHKDTKVLCPANLPLPERIMRTAIGLLALLLTAVTFGEDTKPVSHRVLGADKGYVRLLSTEGQVEWEARCWGGAHDLTLLPNGNILFPVSAHEIVEMTPDKKIVWRYDSKPQAPYTGPIEVHAFQRLDNGWTMIAESGNRRIIEVDADGKIQKEIALVVDHPHRIATPAWPASWRTGTIWSVTKRTPPSANMTKPARWSGATPSIWPVVRGPMATDPKGTGPKSTEPSASLAGTR